jgi:protein-tyrosine phosphatase
MIDLRCHLFDGTACGTEDFRESLELCRQAAQEGVRTIVAVQRWDAGQDEPQLSFNACQRKLERLQSETGAALTLKAGFVFRFHPALDKLIKRYGSSVTLGGGRHVLVALPSVSTPTETEEVWEKLAKLGFSVLVAAPECSHDLRRDRVRLENWLGTGVKLQLCAASITGAHGREAQRFALHCAKEYRGHTIVASNAREAGARRPSLALARETLERHLGKGRAHALFNETPAAILESETDALAEVRKQNVSTRLIQQILRFRKAATDAP